MKKQKAEKEIIDIKPQVESTPFLSENSDNYFNIQNFYNERSKKMINSINPTNQTVQPLANVVFLGNNVISNKCNTCCGSINHNDGSGIFTITKPGVYKVHFNANVAPTVAGPITLNITNSGENISGGEMKSPGTTVGVFDNVSAEILVKVCPNQSVPITIKNSTPTNPITVSQPSLIITREC